MAETKGTAGLGAAQAVDLAPVIDPGGPAPGPDQVTLLGPGVRGGVVLLHHVSAEMSMAELENPPMTQIFPEAVGATAA